MIIFTDGSAHPNPGPGGFGVVVFDDEMNFVTCFSQQTKKKTTNNREELKAIIWAYEHYGLLDEEEFMLNTIITDSSYSANTIKVWKQGWKNNNWKKAKGTTPENLDLVQKIDDLESKGYKMEIKIIKGHNGNLGNDLADALATGKITIDEVIKKYGR